MKRKTKVLGGVGLVATLVAATAVGLVLAQSADETTSSIALPQTFLGRVAANLGVEDDALVEAMTQARLQTIDEAVEQGRITEQQAKWMKEQLEAQQTMLQMIEEALAEGEISQEQADLMTQQLSGRWLGGGKAFGPNAGFGGAEGRRPFGGFGCWNRGR